jgi:hypothetical protein
MAGNHLANGKSTRRPCLGTTHPMQINLSSLDAHRNDGVYVYFSKEREMMKSGIL